MAQEKGWQKILDGEETGIGRKVMAVVRTGNGSGEKCRNENWQYIKYVKVLKEKRKIVRREVIIHSWPYVLGT